MLERSPTRLSWADCEQKIRKLHRAATGDVTEDEVREAAQLLERRAAHEQVREQTRHLAEQVENQSRMNERLEEAGFDPLPSYSELRRGNVE